MSEQRIEVLDVLIECLTQATSRWKARALHRLRDKVALMGEYVKQIAGEQVAAEPEILRCTDEISSALGTNLHIVIIPGEEVQNWIMIQCIQYEKC